MTHDNDLIRRGAILELCQTLEDEAPSGSYDNGGTTDGWMMACRRIEKAIAALPAVAASQPADPVTNAASRQRVVVKPLVWEEVNPGVFVAESSLGVWSRFDGHYMRPDASGGIASDNPEAAAQADYETRILAALDVQTDPRDAQIAALVEAIQANIVFAENIADALDVDPDKTCLNVRVMPEGREVASKSWADVMREGRAAIAAVKGGDA